MSNINIKHKATAILSRLFRYYVMPYKWRVIVAVGFMIIVSICNVAIAKLVQPAIDDVFTRKDTSMFMYLPLYVILVWTLKGIAEFGQSYHIKYVGQRILTNLQMEMYAHLLGADLAFIEKQSSGRLISRFTNDIALMRGAVSHMLVGGAKHFTSIIFLIVFMFYLDYVLSLIVFFAFPAAIFFVQKIGKKMRAVSDTAQDELGNYTAQLDETFSSIKVIKSFLGEKNEAARANFITNNILLLYKKAATFDAMTSPIMDVLTGLMISCILWYGGYKIIHDETTAGTLIAFMTAFVSAYRPFKSLISLNVNLQEGLSAANRVFNILDTKPSISDNENAKDIKLKVPYIQFKDVGLIFGKKHALQSLSLALDSGKCYAFVGRSGSGKTSICNLLARFYDPSHGEILIDNHDLREFKLASLRSQVTFVFQDTILFDSTVAYNISYGNLDVSKDKIIEAAQYADAHDFISELPSGYDTLIGQKGATLSGGQRQRLAIARAFLKNSPLLILDEATSALDPASESKILASLAKIRKGKTTIIITHRLSSVINADKILVMKHGKIVDSGKHQSLLNNQGEYFKLYIKEQKKVTTNLG